MSGAPTVSVITPTWQRHDKLLTRCIPAVAAQTYPHVEHIIVSDGPDDHLADLLPTGHRQRYAQLGEHDPAARWGHWARLRGLELARGEYIGYCDDDDVLRPEHCELLVAALEENPGAGFAYPQAQYGGGIIGCDPPMYCNIGTPQMFHRREILAAATWEQSLPSIDWDLVDRWMGAGIGWVFVRQVTCEIWPSAQGQ